MTESTLSNSSTSTKVLAYALAGVVVVPAALLIWLVCAVAGGFVLQLMWGWFVPPTFGLAALSLPQAIGLDLLITWVVMSDTTQVKREWYETIGMSLYRTATFLTVGFVVSRFL